MTSITWVPESIRYGRDDKSGVEIEQLTSEPVTSTNIYCEQRYASADGARIAIARLADLNIDRKLFLHINNSNPALLPGSPERKAAEQAGWQIPADGTEIVL